MTNDKRSTPDRKDLLVILICTISILLCALFKTSKFSLICFQLVFFILLIYNCRLKPHSDASRPTEISLGDSSAIRGISALEIMMGHIGLHTGTLLLYPNRKAGIFFVGLFFMLSGFGLMHGLNSKKDYLKGLLPKRLIKLLPPFIIVILITLAITGSLSSDLLFSYARWYVWELIGLYICFVITARYFKRFLLPVILSLSAIFSLAAYFLDLDNPWYGSIFCFSLGLLLHKVPQKIFRSIWLFIGVTVILLCSTAGFYVLDASFLGLVVFRNLASFSFCVLACFILSRISIGNFWTSLLNKISYEIYLVHPVMIAVLAGHKMTDYEFSLITVTLSVIGAVALHYIVRLPGLIRGSKS